MTCTIDNLKFTLDENGTVSVNSVSNLTLVHFFHLSKKDISQKEFEQECSYWYFENIMR